MDPKVLLDIARAAVRRKARWCPPTLTAEDLLQEAVAAILESERTSKIRLDPIELQRLAELALVKVMRKESARREYPTANLVDE